MKSLRGALVVVEGCDRSGKTTQCKKIVSTLQNENVQAEYMNFPGKPIAFICSLKNCFPSDDDSVKCLGVTYTLFTKPWTSTLVKLVLTL